MFRFQEQVSDFPFKRKCRANTHGRHVRRWAIGNILVVGPGYPFREFHVHVKAGSGEVAAARQHLEYVSQRVRQTIAHRRFKAALPSQVFGRRLRRIFKV